MDKNYTINDISVDTLIQMRTECTIFLQSAEVSALLNDSNLSAESAGHDFWLTRNGHGAGFWDRGLGAVGEKLTRLAHGAGERTMYVGDDSQIHIG
jgi:hypothetical protein